ncbi:MAG: single-stranded-DNA-specific exonuclease RecJ [bacterium]|nr:single-stranded-DNA-specific exonuclease RecJ [bacterium]
MKFPEIFEKLLKAREIAPDEQADFLKPDYLKLHDPLLMPDMEKARDRIIEAIKNNQHIFVFSDYDADGIPGAVVMSDFFKRIKYENVTFYIPHRHNEGFGLNTKAIDEAVEKNTKLLITIDCGVADIAEVSYANEKGIDVIITDHHEQKENLPKAFAIVNPMRKDSNYPFKDLCGAAVIYKVIQAIVQKENFGVKNGMEKWSLDMVGIATLSDMVPLRGENRILAHFGLEVLRKSPRPGLASLFKKLSINQKYLTEDDVAFMITPRINAASRMGKPEDAFQLLATSDMREAESLAIHLESINNERKGIVASLVKDAKKHLSKRQELKKVIVIGNPEWRPSLLGLVANSLVEEYKMPAFVWGRDGDGIIKGSCRSYGNINLCLLMDIESKSFIEHGGHSQAGGFAVSLENISLLEDKLSVALENSKRDIFIEKEKGEVEIQIEYIGEDLWKTISIFAPFGVGNPKPIFRVQNAEIKTVKTFGKTGDHIEVTFSSPKSRDVKAISFFSDQDSFGPMLSPLSHVVLDAHLEKSYFRNRPEIRLRIVDIKK